MAFLSTSDLTGSISTSTLNQLIAAGASFANCLDIALSELAPLRDNFDIDAETAKTSSSRNTELLRIVKALTVYYLFNTVEDDSIPERVKDNYTKELKTILSIAQGKQGTTIDRLTDDDGEDVTSFRVDKESEPRDLDYHWQ